jgi:hypothetical protein
LTDAGYLSAVSIDYLLAKIKTESCPWGIFPAYPALGKAFKKLFLFLD